MSQITHFCTLFDIRYLSRGLAMYESLCKTQIDFHLYIFPFCQASLDLLRKLALPHVTVIPQQDFETKALLAVKAERTAGEYCWTCTPAVIEYVIEQFKVPSCTYVDADLYFFSSPKVLIDEMGDAQVLLTEHRYTSRYDHAKVSGIYCVQFMCFKAESEGLKALKWWKEKCIEWCYARVEPDKFGDQKYLDDWPTRFDKVHVLKHLGGGLAPWNIQQYKLRHNGGQLVGTASHDFPVIFYHFHQLQLLKGNQVDLGGYQLDDKVLPLIYKPYINHLRAIESKLGVDHDIHGKGEKKSLIAKLKRSLLGCNNIYAIRRFEHG